MKEVTEAESLSHPDMTSVEKNKRRERGEKVLGLMKTNKCFYF